MTHARVYGATIGRPGSRLPLPRSMPSSPLKLCATAGCAARVSHRTRYCQTHAVREAKAREARRAPRVLDGELMSGGGRRVDWRALRAEVLARDPICVDCRARESTHADHIVAKRDGGRDEASNLQALCPSCHSRKTCRQDNGFGNRSRRQRAL